MIVRQTKYGLGVIVRHERELWNAIGFAPPDCSLKIRRDGERIGLEATKYTPFMFGGVCAMCVAEEAAVPYADYDDISADVYSLKERILELESQLAKLTNG